MAGDRDADALRLDGAARGFDALDPAVIDDEAGDLAILDDVDAALVGGAGIAPGNRVVARGAAAPLHRRANNGIA